AGGAGGILNGLLTRLSSTNYAGCDLFPVEFSAFDAQQVGADVLLTWTTATESNNSHFEVQRSPDGQAFTQAGLVSGAGTSFTATNYDFTDAAPLPGVSWYRLRQVDLNGAFSFSETRRVQFDPALQLIHNIFPNPVHGDEMQVNLYVPETGAADLLVFDAFGKQLMNVRREFAAGMNTLRLAADELAAGVYFLKMNFEGRIETRKFVVAN
ncbi:MAG: T9SS type A sorting domain-containing protein, partial [Bacteroidota bacterium]